jgi:peptidoglycan/LPS O-acetylase OafA/YrhL
MRERLPQLDFLRALACFLVIMSHSPVSADANFIVRSINLGGWVGVDLFFVLSGFLVSGLLFEEYLRTSRVRLLRFAVRRALKVYPAFYFYLCVTTLAIFLLAEDRTNIGIEKLAAEALFVQNYFPSTWGHTWSLAVEEHFYISVILVIGFLVSRIRPKPFAGVPIAVAAICAGCLGLRIIFCEGTHEALIPHTTHMRIDALSFGVLLAYLRHVHSIYFLRLVRMCYGRFLCLGLALLMPSFIYGVRENVWMTTYGLTTNYLGSGCLVAVAVVSERTYSTWFRFVARIGTYSYSIYLWHAVVVNWIIPRIIEPLQMFGIHAGWIFSIVASVLIGVMFAHIVEMPILRVRDRLVPSALIKSFSAA